MCLWFPAQTSTGTFSIIKIWNSLRQILQVYATTKWQQHRNSKGDCWARIYIRQVSLFSLLIIFTHKHTQTIKKPKQNQKSPACFHFEGLVKTKVRSWSLLAEAELLHRKGKFMETERNIKSCTSEKVTVETWSLLATFHLCRIVQGYSGTHCWAPGDSLLSMSWFLLILLKCPILNWGIWVLGY